MFMEERERERREKTTKRKKIGSSHMAYIIEVSVCAEILGTFR